MPSYKFNPYVSFVESRIIPGRTQYAVTQRLTGEVLELTTELRSLLQGIQQGKEVSFTEEQVRNLSERTWLKQLIQRNFLIPQTYDPLSLVVEYLATRPIQNPALTYRNKTGEIVLVRISMRQHVYVATRNELPEVIEEPVSPTAAALLRLADGSQTLANIFRCVKPVENKSLLEDEEFREAVDFLTSQERQLLKFTRQPEDLLDPYKSVNTVPRDLIVGNNCQESCESAETQPVLDFHVRGIADAWWEFDRVEPTVNHGLRFPNQMLGGLDYGSRFCVSTLKPEVTPSLRHKKPLDVLEVGGGTGTFGRSFIKQSQSFAHQDGNRPTLNYHILDLSPVLIENQKQVLADLLPEQNHFHQEATTFDLHGQRFDLIVANEVIADFPVASVRALHEGNEQDVTWTGEGASYLEKYGLTTKDAPAEFKVNKGAMKFIERCWEHLNPGGTVVLSEYGSTSAYPVQTFHLNHEEFSIQFLHLAECATKVGFICRLLSLKEFLGLNDEVSVFSGREEHILCLNHVLKQHGKSFPYAIVSETEFAKRFGSVAEETELAGYSFLPLKKGFYFGPRIEQFMVLILNKPE
jgi:2-polyprenyl-3-methyl-5-hydroxy-6-metoxy-1,4-benzoquinol methylase